MLVKAMFQQKDKLSNKKCFKGTNHRRKVFNILHCQRVEDSPAEKFFKGNQKTIKFHS